MILGADYSPGKKSKAKGSFCCVFFFFFRKAVVDTTNPGYNVYKYHFAQKRLNSQRIHFERFDQLEEV